MDGMNRRDAAMVMTAFALLGGLRLSGQTASGQTGSAAEAPEEHGVENHDLAPVESKVYRFAEMKATVKAGGGWTRPVMHGTLPTGEFMEIHETGLGPGLSPHPPHRHRNTEFLLIREGTLEYTSEGMKEVVGPGDVVYSASDKMHGLKNVGTTLASYFVVSVGHGQM